MKFIVNLVFIILISITSHHGIASNSVIPMGVYEYVYEYNTNDLIENHYIKLSIKNNIIYGEYFGTSDDFDSAREGYLPGFYKSPMVNIKIDGKNISFSVKPLKYYKNSITPYNKTDNNALWDVKIKSSLRSYQGTYIHNKFTINSNGLDPRIFVKM